MRRHMHTLPHDPQVPQATGDALRWDIQALRGVAVAWVLLHHAQLPGIPGGYLGVDIFFVISGYLITGLVQRALLAGRFSFRDFYARRARRLLPAAYVTLALTVAASPWLLNAREQVDLAAQARSALLFASNIVLWKQSGYFQGAAELKPLLHFWSLSLEEQYYLVLPALLWLCAPRWRRVAVFAGVLGSAALCAFWLSRDASFTFYGLPTRAWELGLGSMAALWPPRRRASMVLRLGAAAALLVLPMLNLPGWSHPGMLALGVTLATALLVRQPAEGLSGVAAPALLRPLVWLGDRSYSLYLVHWPLMAAVHNAWLGVDPAPGGVLAGWRLAALGVSLPLAMALHRWVEVPGKTALRGRRGALVLVAASLLLAVLPSLTQRWVQPPVGTDFERATRPNYGFSAACDAEQPYTAKPECEQGMAPTWMVWGDSYAMHLVSGLAVEAGASGLMQATKSSCGPFLTVAPYRPAAAPADTFAPSWLARCKDFNTAVLAWLDAHPEVHTVVLSSLLTQYLDERRYQPRQLGPDGLLSTDYLRGAALQQALLEDLRRTVGRLRASGRRVVFIAPPPRADFNVASCLERRSMGRWTLGAPADCRIDATHRDANADAVAAWLKQAEAIVPVLRFDPLLCTTGSCDVMQSDVMLYRDQGHLSEAGSARLVPRLDWSALRDGPPPASAAQ